MKSLLLAAIGMASLGLAGCQTTSTEISSIAPPPPNYRSVIVEKVKNTLKDPYSIRSAEISEPAPGFVGILYGGTQMVVCTRFNAKNSFGAYTGVETFLFAFSNGKLLGMGQNALAGCENRSYSPFPELENIT
jgi:hypothetical protein